MTANSFNPAQVHGAWRLVSANAVDPRGQVLAPPYGPIPIGRLILNDAGRMMVMICDGRPILPEGEERAYTSYCGNFRIEEDRLTTLVDAASLKERIGSHQIRRIEFRGKYLVLVPPRRSDGEQRELSWELDGSP